MEAILRAAIIYFFLLIMVRVSGKRTLAEITIFDFVLLLIIGDASQQSITGQDYSIINGMIVIVTLILLDTLLSFIKVKSKKAEKILEGSPVIILENGECIKQNLKATGIDEEDILEAARKEHGLENLSQIKYGIMEKDGVISIIPYSNKNK